jgi:hypothetical protein
MDKSFLVIFYKKEQLVFFLKKGNCPGMAFIQRLTDYGAA